MNVTEEQRKELIGILRESRLDALSATGSWATLLQRIDEFGVAYARHAMRIPRGLLPATASLNDVLAEHSRNPHRVRMLLQAVAFRCSPEILTMVWMTLLGSQIRSLSYEYRRKQESSLAVSLQLPDGTTTIEFKSSDHWDTAVLRFAAVSLVNNQPMIEDFHPMWIPPQAVWKHDLFVETAQGSFSAADIAPTASLKPRWEVHEVFAKQPPRPIGSIDVHEHGPVYGSPGMAEDRRLLLEIVWAALTRKYGEGALNRRVT
jgi:hypothetical protein